MKKIFFVLFNIIAIHAMENQKLPFTEQRYKLPSAKVLTSNLSKAPAGSYLAERTNIVNELADQTVYITGIMLSVEIALRGIFPFNATNAVFTYSEALLKDNQEALKELEYHENEMQKIVKQKLEHQKEMK